MLGPFGLSNLVFNCSLLMKKLQSGTNYHYILILLLSTTLFVTGFFFMDSLAGVDLRLFVVFVLSVFVFSH